MNLIFIAKSLYISNICCIFAENLGGEELIAGFSNCFCIYRGLMLGGASIQHPLSIH